MDMSFARIHVGDLVLVNSFAKVVISGKVQDYENYYGLDDTAVKRKRLGPAEGHVEVDRSLPAQRIPTVMSNNHRKLASKGILNHPRPFTSG
ncbi:unnamed protein product [Gongylonema pulchrum]|uniref:MCM_OB domain-containing protein n=1 Tax=Gongylonema pulchrum TaxID=637853 RepID=A0A183EYE1_9BILA|nr:unnamed protein product [Gongylonema pulchrum]